MTRIALVIFMLGPASFALAESASECGFEHFVSRDVDRLMDGKEELRFVSWNVPNLLVLEDSFAFLGDSPWRWPDAFEIADAFETAKQMQGTVVRSYVLTVKREGSDMGDHVHVLGPGEFNEQAFETLDLVLKIANEKGVRVILPLVDNWKWMGGVAQYAAFRDKPAEAFWTDQQLIDDFKKTIHHVLNRRNTLTGVLYRDDPAILCWETGNELDSPPEWTAQIAAYIKSLDSNHLVLDGRALRGFPAESLNDPNIDIISTHHYPNTGNNNAKSIIKNAALARGKMPYFVGEFGFAPLDEAQRMLDAVIDENLSGALYWSLRYHRREGGFYWHHEPAGGDVYKAYHWPGFAEGHEYREHLVLPMLRKAACRIQGIEIPSIAPPKSPKLLPIASPAHISWQGATGASGYRIERAESPEGPWQIIGDKLSDAFVQYRPLFCDATAEANKPYFYRVLAENQGGVSAPSNVVGPVESPYRTLVDELADLSLIHETTGEVAPRTNDARKVQEDIHRLVLKRGASVVYQVNEPLVGVTVYLFSNEQDATLEVALSTDGLTYQSIEPRRSSVERSGGDYGYLTPVLLEADLTSKGARYLRLTLDADAEADEIQLSRVELRYGG